MHSKRRIAIIYSGGPAKGGIETYLESLFSNFHEPDMELTLLSLGDWEFTRKLKEETDKVEIFSGSRFRPQTVFEIAKILKDKSFDLVVTNGNVSTAYGRAASMVSGVPNLAVVHSDIAFDYPNPLLRLIYHVIDFVTRFETKHYIVVSKYLSDLLIESGVKPKQITVVYNGVAVPEGAQKSAGKEGNIVIRSLGRLHYVKGFHNLIVAMGLLKDQKLLLEIGGEGTERKQLEALIMTQGITNNVKLVGQVEDPLEFIRGADIYVQPSLSEGFGLTVVDAMLCEVPVVVTPRGSLNEIVVDEKTGVVAADVTPVAIASAIKYLADDKQLQSKLAQDAKQYAEKNFSVQKWIQETVRIYRETMK